MKTKKTVIQTTLVMAFGTAVLSAQAATLNTGDLLTINAGVPVYDTNGYVTNITSGSWYGLDTDANGSVDAKAAMTQGATGLMIGVTQIDGEIDAPTTFFTTSVHHTSIAITGDTVNGLNFSGWRWLFLSNDINMGSGAWGIGFTNGKANISWDGIYGHAYILDYAATIPSPDPCNCGPAGYRLHLEGVVASPVPIPAAAWLFGSGLLGLMGATRRKAKRVSI